MHAIASSSSPQTQATVYTTVEQAAPETVPGEASADEREDYPTLPAVPDLPGVETSPGQDEGQPDYGRAPAESPAAPAGVPSTDPVREEEGDGEELEISYFPEISERARDLVDQIHSAQARAVMDAILLCGAAPVLAAAGGASAGDPTATMLVFAGALVPPRCVSSRRLRGDRQRYAAAYATRCALVCSIRRQARMRNGDAVMASF